MLKRSDVQASGLREVSGGLPKFYPCFRLCISRPGHEWREVRSGSIQASDWVFNIIFKKDYSFRYREVSAECRGHETRHDG